MTGSLAYRKNEAAILRGDLPAKYLRILPHISGKRIIELGSAEGVLALELARAGKHVMAVEASPERHDAATRLRNRWCELGLMDGISCSVSHVVAKAQDAVTLIEPGQFDTLVAIRMIYYLRGDIDTVFAAMADRIPTVVLCGNRNRADAWRAGRPHEPLGEWNRYASAEGMCDLLARHGYGASIVEPNGDEIVVGRRG